MGHDVEGAAGPHRECDEQIKAAHNGLRQDQRRVALLDNDHDSERLEAEEAIQLKQSGDKT